MVSAVAAIGAMAATSSQARGWTEQLVRVGDDSSDGNEGGNDVLSTVAPVEIVSYLELTNTGQTVGESSRRTEMARSDRQESFVKKKEKKTKITPRGQSFKRGRYATSRSQRQNNDQRTDNHLGPNSEGQASTQLEDLRCPRCKKYHTNRPCRARLGVCYECGKSGHIDRDYPHRKRREAAESDSQTRGNHKLAVGFLTFLCVINM
ncbi:hypothetical protein Ahy_A07g034344 isoform B [Arachis hypogaea]|nr:hypothetical protein Ahy_A07g034344 isoform B [Arachis hypogaea]